MKNTAITLFGLSLCALAYSAPAQEAPAAPAAPAAAQAATPTDAEVNEIVSYFLGYRTGMQFSTFGEGPILPEDIDQNVFFKALLDGLNQQPDEEMQKKDNIQACMDAFAERLIARTRELSRQNIAKSQAYAEMNGKKDGVVTTESGLQYKVLTPSDGRTWDQAKDGSNAQMSITYEGRLLDGTVFDKTEEPIQLAVSGVIPGFAEALKKMPIGAEWEIFIPSELGYGEQGPGPLGANSALIFTLKLHDITPAGTQDSPIQLTPEMLRQLQEAGMQPIGQ